MKKAFNREYPITCSADTEEVALMHEVLELIKQRQELDLRRKSAMTRLAELFDEDPEDPDAPHGYLKGPDCEAHWCTNPRSISWEMLEESFPDVYEELKGNERRGEPFLVVTPHKKK